MLNGRLSLLVVRLVTRGRQVDSFSSSSSSVHPTDRYVWYLLSIWAGQVDGNRRRSESFQLPVLLSFVSAKVVSQRPAKVSFVQGQAGQHSLSLAHTSLLLFLLLCLAADGFTPNPPGN